MKIHYHLPLLAVCLTCFLFQKSFAQKQAQKRIDSLKNIWNHRHLPDTTRLQALDKINIQFSELNQFDSVLFYAQAQLKFANEKGIDKHSAGAYTSIGNVYFAYGSLEEAKTNYATALKFFEKIKDDQGRALALNNLGNIYGSQSNYEEAIKCFTESLKIAEAKNNKKQMMRSNLNISHVYTDKGDFSIAISFVIKGMKLADEMGDKYGMYVSRLNVGNLYAKQNDNLTARKYYEEGLDIAKKANNKNWLSSAHNSLGVIFEATGKLDSAMYNYTNSIKLAEELGMNEDIIVTLNNMGNISTRRRDFTNAFNYYFRALRIAEQIDSKLALALSYNNLGGLNQTMGKFKEARKMQEKSLEAATAANAKLDMQYAYLRISQCDSALSNWSDAYTNYKLYSTLKDSIFNKESSRQIAEMQTKYETEKKENEIVVLQKDKNFQKAEVKRQKLIRNSILFGAALVLLSIIVSFLFYKRKRDAVQKQKETALSLQISETEMKSLRSQMNPHFIFNALQSIQTFLIAHRSDEANTYLLKFAKLMRLVLENSQHSAVPLLDDMQALEYYMQLENVRMAHPFTYEFHINSALNTEETTIPPLILQPIVENAIIHGLQKKPGNGHIDISISKKDNVLYATVEDNGVGREASQKNVPHILFKKKSLGMKLTEDRLKILTEIKKIPATLTVIDLFTPDNRPAGTKVELLLPLIA